jgi:hypothetical protein
MRFALDLALEQPEGTIYLIPVRLENCEVPESLREWHWVDLFEERGYARLVAALKTRQPYVEQEVTSDPLNDQRNSERVSPSKPISTRVGASGEKVLQFALGLETLGGVFTKLIPEGTRLPAQCAEVFSTAKDHQTSVEVHVLTGLHPSAKENTTLAKFSLVGIPPAPRGMPQIEVTFEIDSLGILHVSALDLGTKKQQKIVIRDSMRESTDQKQ